MSNGKLIISGEALSPAMVAESPYRSRLSACFLGIADPIATFERLSSNHDPLDWTNRFEVTQLLNILDKFAKRSQELADQCQEYGLLYIGTSNDIDKAHQTARLSLTLGLGSVAIVDSNPALNLAFAAQDYSELQ